MALEKLFMLQVSESWGSQVDAGLGELRAQPDFLLQVDTFRVKGLSPQGW